MVGENIIIIFLGILFAVLLSVFGLGPKRIPDYKHSILRLFLASFAALASYYFTGKLSIVMEAMETPQGQITLKAGAGAAFFVFIYLFGGSTKEKFKGLLKQVRKDTKQTRKDTTELRKSFDEFREQYEEDQKKFRDCYPPVESVQEAKNPLSEEERAAFETRIAELEQTEREAKELYNRELERGLETQRSYAGVLMREAKYKEAEAVYRGLINVHPENTSVLNGLGLVLLNRAKFDQAEPFIRQALKIDEDSFGPDHPDVAIDLNNLAQLLKATNRLDEAEPLMRRSLGIFEKSLGPEHPSTKTVRGNLEALLKEMEKRGE